MQVVLLAVQLGVCLASPLLLSSLLWLVLMGPCVGPQPHMETDLARYTLYIVWKRNPDRLIPI
jgi:hypothetical protein